MPEELTQEQLGKLKKLASFMEDKDFSYFEKLDEIAEHLKAISEKEMPEMPHMEMPEVHKVEIRGAEVLTIKGEKGDMGEVGEKGEQGERGFNGKDGKDGKDGRDGIDGKDGINGKDGIDGKNGENGKDGSPDTPEQIVNKINEASSKINKEKIDGLDDEIKTLRNDLSGIPRGGMKKFTYVKRVNLTSQCNGVLKSFALPKDTVAVLGVWGTQFPISFDTADFTLTGNTLTLTSEVSAPETGQTLFALVETLFYS